MTIKHIEIPEQTRARRQRLTDSEVAELAKMLRAGKTPSDGELYVAKGKGSAKTRAYSAGFAVRRELAARSDLDLKRITVRTWADGEGFRWALAMKDGK